jgi:pyruvate dehydrogenase E2 component (dihydrolipoamide acetyltransferase)
MIMSQIRNFSSNLPSH